MDMTSYFLGRNAAGNSSSGVDFNIVEPATDETFEDTDIYNANGMNVVINGILEMIDGMMPTLSDLVAESISDCERTYNKTKYIDINSDENLYPDAKAVYEYGQRIAQSRQEILVSGENIKTINGQSILGSGELEIESGSDVNIIDFNPEGLGEDTVFNDNDIYNANGILRLITMFDEVVGQCELEYRKTNIIDENSDEYQYPSAKATYEYGQKISESKQDKLVDDQNIKTINGQSILGKGDLVIGGGSSSGEEWEHICDIPVVEDTENPIFKITQSLGANYKKLHVIVNKDTAGGLVATGGDSYPLRIFGNSHHNNNLIAQFGGDVTSNGWSFYSCEIDYNKYANLITGWSSICPGRHWKTINGNIQRPIHTLFFVNNAQSGATKGFRTFTIKVWGVRAE